MTGSIESNQQKIRCDAILCLIWTANICPGGKLPADVYKRYSSWQAAKGINFKLRYI